MTTRPPLSRWQCIHRLEWSALPSDSADSIAARSNGLDTPQGFPLRERAVAALVTPDFDALHASGLRLVDFADDVFGSFTSVFAL